MREPGQTHGVNSTLALVKEKMESKGSSSTPPPPEISVDSPDDSVDFKKTQQQSLSLSDGSQDKGTQIHATQPDGTSVTPPNTKLCGYLNKQGGPLKTWKSRWFAYEERSCQLFYYRMAQDISPLGKVDLSCATFSYPLQGEEGTFHIQTPERTFILKAINKDTQMYWLQQLQLKRALFREQNAEHQPMPRPDNQSVESKPSASTGPANFLPIVKTPSGLVGEEAASLPAPGIYNPLNMSLKHPLIELQNTMHSFRNRQSQEIRQSVFHIDNPNDTQKTPPSKSPTLAVPTSNPNQNPESPANARLEDLKDISTKSQIRKNSKERSKPLDQKDTPQLQHENLSLAEEVKAQKELVMLLRKVLEAAQLEKRTCAQFLAAEGEQERLELLRRGERRVAELQDHLESLQQENENLRRDLNQRDAHIAELQGSVQQLLNKNQAKQEVIVRLSDKLAACGEDQQCNNGLETFKQPTMENEQLKDDLQAYKIQNQYLNSEIFQLTTLWRKSSEQEKSMIVKCAVLEANNGQIESKYLGVLQKLQESEQLSPEQREAVRKVVKDVVQADLNIANKLNRISDHDEYGFRTAVDYKVEDLKLLAKFQTLEMRTQNMLHREEGDGTWLARCAQLLFGRPEGELSSPTEMKALLRRGLPCDNRAKIWRSMIQTRTKTLKEHHPRYYQELCERSRNTPHLVPRQIQLDLDRTLTSNKHFSPSSPLIPKLERVLQAFSCHSLTIGYVQGLNRLAAIALLVLQEEEDAFWCLVVIVEHVMPFNYYTKDLLGCQADQRVLKDLVSEKLPRLTAHLEMLKVDVSLITVEWFLVLFVENLPTHILFKVWDALLYEGIKVIFRYALALFKYREENILKIQDSAEMYQYLRIFPSCITDGRKLTSIAFNDMNPLPMKAIRKWRAAHLERLHAEIKELENLQKAYKAEHVQCKDKKLDSLASDDEEEVYII